MEMIEKARALVQKRNFELALDIYLDALRSLSCVEKELLEDEVVTLAETCLRESSDAVFLRLLDFYPKSAKLFFMYGCMLLRSEKLRFAAAVTQRGLAFHPLHLPLLDLQQRINFKAVDRWHFRMINDKLRNQSYYDAIERKISSGCETVLDIGCGTGILSIFAVKSGAQQVYACDSSQTMCSIAKYCIDCNNCSQKIRLFCADSSLLRIPDHVPERVHLIVCEIFDGGLLGENCLETLEDANLRLSSQIGGLSGIIPAKARFFMMGITSERIRNSHRAVYKDQIIYDKIGDEPYDLEFLDSSEFECLTEKMKVLEVDFGNLESLRQCKNFSQSIQMACTQEGIVDAIIGWFELDLDEVTTLTNSPWNGSCWEQVVYPSRKLVQVKKGEKINLSVKVSRPAGAKSHFITLKLNNRSSDPSNCLFQDISVIRKLNDPVLQRYRSGCLQNLTRTGGGVGRLKVLNLSRSAFLFDSDLPNSDVFCTGDYDYVGDAVKIMKEDAIAGKLMFDVIVADLVREAGTLMPEGFQDLDFWRSHLSRNGICMTRRLIVYAMPVSSEYLETNSSVTDPVMFSKNSVTIGESINKYKTMHSEEISLGTARPISLSAPKKALILEFEDLWKDKEKNLSFRIGVPGRLTGVLYWFESKAFPSVSFNTFESSSFQKAAFLVNPKHVEAGEIINVYVKYTPGYLLMTVV